MLRSSMVLLALIVSSLVATAAETLKPKLEPGVYNGEFAVTNRNTLRLENGPVTVVIGADRQVTVYMWSEGRGRFSAERYTGGDTSMFTDAQRQILAENGY